MGKVKIFPIILLSFLLFFSNNYCFSQEETSAEGYVNLGSSSLEKESYVLAFGYFKKALEIDSAYAPAIQGLKNVYSVISQKPEKEVSELIDTALQKYPEYSNLIHFGLSFIYQAKGLNQRALEELEKIKDKERISPYSPDFFYVVKANAYAGLGEISKAQQELEDALQFFPDSAALHSSIANIYSSQGEIHKAIFHYQKVLELKPDIENAEQIRQQIESLKNSQGFE